MREGKKILDACCGSKMFWFDKNNPDVEFCDIRKLERTEYYPGRYIEVNPNTVCDFTELPFADNSFHLVAFDPPHLKQASKNSILATKYGRLEGDWRDTLKKGFDECMRVLRPNGILVFKWSEVQITLKEVLQAIGVQPLFGNKQPKQCGTHWLCFMKGGGAMMEREAVNILSGDFSDITLKQSESHSDMFAEAFKMATEALKKQIPKRPYFEGDGYDPEGEIIYDTWRCPSCGEAYEVDYDIYEYCPNCGQAIDWNEE